ncbi:hypothetical protein [Aquincola sp. J276]|uniref:hypothetical protein n=1 Tax=Aquincola sp. J276 TaxID=2898432 RepID=UPI0021513B46|nr:hypothetical protein [Aquincola sp. J276]MCR5866082.1 hypothetical protein [Aquincola sp. J276]
MSSPDTAPTLTEPALPAAPRRGGGRQAPLYRVVEVTRDAAGRLTLQGRIWHSDLDRLRRFGRALAANSQSHRVVIADGQGSLVEEIHLAAPDQRQPLWGQWQQLPLPPVPPATGTSMLRPAPKQPPAAPRVQPQPQQLQQVKAEVPAEVAELAEVAQRSPVRQPPRHLPRLSQPLPAALPPAPPPRD